MAISVGDAVLKISGDTKSLEKDLGRIQQKMDKMAKGMMIAGAAILAGVGAGVKAWADAGDEIAKMSKRMGVATETLSEWKYMADLSGTSLGAMEKGFKKLAMSISDAKDGLMTYTREFDKIGINVEELAELSPDEQFMKVAKAVAAIEDPMQRAASAQKLFGRAGMELLPLLAEGEEGIAKLADESHRMAKIWDADAAAAAERLNDAMTKVKTSSMNLVATLAEELGPGFADILEQMAEVIASTVAWAKDNEWLAKAILGIGVALVGGGGLLFAITKIVAAFRAMAIAAAVVHAFMGPAGWAKLAIGAGIAAGAIAGINAMTKEEIPTGDQPSLITKPGLIYAGKTPEIIAPLSDLKGMGGTNLSINVGNFMGDEMSLRDLTRRVEEILGQETRRSFNAPTQTSYYSEAGHL